MSALLQVANVGVQMTAQVAMPKEPDDLTAPEIDMAIHMFIAEGLNRSQLLAAMREKLKRPITENMIAKALAARGVNKNDARK